jgi:protein phosphatase-4 regulatory subunit 3
MVRMSLQLNDKDEFYSVVVNMKVHLVEVDEVPTQPNEQQAAQQPNDDFNTPQRKDCGNKSNTLEVSLLSLLANILSDPNVDVQEKGLSLEITSNIAVHDPMLIRRHCLELHELQKKQESSNIRPSDQDVSGDMLFTLKRPIPNCKNQVIFPCSTDDILASLLYLLAVEADAGLLLQVAEVMRIVLDDMLGDHGPLTFADEAEGVPAIGALSNVANEHHLNTSSAAAITPIQNQFLSLFYEHYVPWLVVPFQCTVLHPARRVFHPAAIQNEVNPQSPLIVTMVHSFQLGVSADDPLLQTVAPNSIRSSFGIELLSFCVRTHLYRMKMFLLRSKVLGSVLKLLRASPSTRSSAGDRCLKLGALR